MVRQDIDIKACAAGEKGEAGNSAAHQSAGAGDIIVGPFIAWQISATHHHSEGIGIRIDWWARRLLSLRSASRYQKHCRKCRYTRGSFHESPFLSAITPRSEEHTSELQSLMRISYAVF